ncbi:MULTISPECIES: DUF1707 SHOCT-like domain-containing protein [Streptomyces]|uniref:DUF1707 domain-containing protein n=1 Tax=Streptomyces sudanensis TaxID=436397 RepID=A0ABY4TI73_9ACTN|nr:MULTISPECIES: DUF1707 domain-containing protein [Streptomyces]MCP9957500.1 DUF1707 domain-containing protein [Streptomyces sudanensis]MCP9986638.1 DUF1707 domain-containing protein [Streptomyces sudanensis]MCQ0001954.1 DUF1707 domain-containing protein [Streptomyces sudanensis]URN18612.1 DUF1707 domain-containing protein [Streptomyces sudanensis]
MRASDADRDRIADILRDALAEGRIDAQEHEERVDAVYRAKTLAELEPLVGDLPAVPSPAPAAGPRAEVAYGADDTGGAGERLIAVFSGNTRRGHWRVAPRITAFSLFGNIEIDLTEATFAQRLTTIDAVSVFGSVEVRVPENVSLRGNGTGVFGNFEVRAVETADPEAPVVVVNGYSVFGSVEARPRRGKRVADLLHEKLRKHLGH